MGSAHPNLVPYRAFEVNDGWFVIAVGSDNQWNLLCDILQIEKLTEWETNAGRIEHRSEIENQISKIIGEYSREELEQMLSGIPCAPINTIEEAFNDPQSVSRGVIEMVGEVPTLASPLRFINYQKKKAPEDSALGGFVSRLNLFFLQNNFIYIR